MAGHEDALRKLTVNDESAMENELGLRMALSPEHPLDLKTGALVRLSALVAIGAAPPSFQWAGAAAVRSGATPDEVVSTLCAIAPIWSSTCCVLGSAAASGSCTLTNSTPWSSVGMKAVGVR